jgi:5'-nucleotidase
VALDPAKYITYDPNIFPMFEGFRRAGRKVFLLTNSLWEYTNVVMNYLEGRKKGDQKDLEWTKYLDIIIVGGNKPAFLEDERYCVSVWTSRA